MIRSNFLLFVLSTGIPIHASAIEWNRCPETNSGKNLTAWRNILIEKVVEGKYKEVQTAVEGCFPDSRPTCLGDLEYYVDTKISPEAYGDLHLTAQFAEKDLTIKSEKELPHEFLVKDKNGKIIPGAVQIPKDILNIAKKKGWENVLYKTRSSGGFDKSANLFLLNISNEKLDVFLQTSPHGDKDESTEHNPIPQPRNSDFTDALATLTVITVDKTRIPPVGQLRLLTRSYDAKTDTYGPYYKWKKRTSNFTMGQDCLRCHTQPTRPISPLGFGHVNGPEKKMTPEQAAHVEALNTKLSSVTSWGRTVVNGKEIRFGIPIDSQPTGWAPENSDTRNENFIKECSSQATPVGYVGANVYTLPSMYLSETDKIDISKVAGAMNCVKCHDGNTRGVLHENFSWEEIQFKVALDRSMPLGMDLNNNERLALLACLKLERDKVKEAWRKSGAWMNKASCFGDQFKGKPQQNVQQLDDKKTNSTKAISQ